MEYKSRVAGIFDRSVLTYGKFGSHYFDIFAERLLSHMQGVPGANVLDVATGRGAVLKLVLPMIGQKGKAVGIDISPKMIEALQEEIRKPNVSLFCMDAEHLSFADNTFDIIYCGFGLFFFPDPKKALREFQRVLKPGGKIAVSTWGKMSIHKQAMSEKLLAMGIDPTIIAFPMPSVQELNTLFTETGFLEVRVVQDRLEHPYANFDQWWNSLWGHGMRTGLEELNKEQLASLKAKLFEELKSEYRPDGFYENLEVFYTLASK